MNYAVEIERRAFYNIAIKAIHTFYFHTRTKIVQIEFIFLHDLSLHMLSHIVIVFHLKVHEKYCIICLWYVITEIAMSKEADNIYVLWEIYLLSHCSFLMEDGVFAFFYQPTPTDLPFQKISSLLLLFEMEFRRNAIKKKKLLEVMYKYVQTV